MLVSRQAARGGLRADRRCVAALEFAFVAPVLALMTVGTFDLARAFVVWQQLNDAAEAITEAAEKLAIPAGGADTVLNQVQMQAAMSSIYAEIPGLQWGSGTGAFPGAFAVTLSSVQYLPACEQTEKCPPQAPTTVWSAFLNEGGPQLNRDNSVGQLWRACGPLLPVDKFPDNARELSVMVVPQTATGQPLVPQVVTDVRYEFTPNFPLAGFFGIAKSFTLWASATLPSPLGSLTRPIAFDPAQGSLPSVLNCGGTPPVT